jgi:hypothetical protein
MERFVELLMPFLWDVAICLAFELFIFINYKTPFLSGGEIIMCPIIPKLTTHPFEAMVYSMFALVIYWEYKFFDVFSDMPLDSRREFILRSLSYGSISAAEYKQGFYDDWWDVKYLFVIPLHYICMVALCYFIPLSMLCGLLIQSHLPAWEIPFRPIFDFVDTCSACVWGVLSLLGQAVRIGQSVLLWFLDWCLYEDPASLIVCSTGLIISDMLCAIWATTYAMIPIKYSVQRHAFKVFHRLPDDDLPLAWYWMDVIPSHFWETSIVKRLGVMLQSYSMEYAKSYNNQYEDDELHHFPLLTVPITMVLLYYACKLLWEDKPRKLKKLERVVEESILNNAVIEDYESHLSTSKDKMNGLMQVLAANSRLLADAILQRKKMLGRHEYLEAVAERLRAKEGTQSQRFQQYVKENMALHRENEELRNANEVVANTENHKGLNAQLAALNDENSDLRQQKAKLKSELDYMRDAKSTAEAMVTAAEKKAALEISMHRQQKAELTQRLETMNQGQSDADDTVSTATAEKEAGTEAPKLRQDIDKLRQENDALQQTYQQVLSENQILVKGKSDAEDVAKNHADLIESLQKSNQLSEKKSELLQARIEANKWNNQIHEDRIKLLEAKLAEAEAEVFTTRQNAMTEVLTARQNAEEVARRLRTELDDLNARTVKEIESTKAQERNTTTASRKKYTQLRKRDRLRQKKVLIMRHTFTTSQHRLTMDMESVRRDNQRLEHRIVQMEPELRGHTQIIHDVRKDNEREQLRQQLQQHRSRNFVLDGEVKRLEDENKQLRAAAMGSNLSTAPSPFSSSATHNPSESDQLVTLRNELKSKDEELQRLEIQLSNARMSRRGTGSNPFMPPSRGRGRARGT